jgi:hypothetical protein
LLGRFRMHSLAPACRNNDDVFLQCE